MRLGDDREEVLTYDQIIQAMNKKFEDGHQCCMFKDIIGHKKVRNETMSSGIMMKRVGTLSKS